MNLQEYRDKKILFLGKPRAFSQEEFTTQLASHHITLQKELEDAIDTVLEGRMMTPYEQNLSDELYEKGGFTFLEIDAFEEALAKKIDDNVLLMSLKLSNDKERLKSFLQNSCVSDTLFFKLLEMYKWSGEDFFENDDNRDVTAALIGRFYENIERNHNVQYATTGLIHLVSQTKNPELLEAISALEPLKFHPKLSILLAQHPCTPKKVLKKLLREGDTSVLEAMCANSALDIVMIKELAKDEVFARILAAEVRLNDESFAFLKEFITELASNETLTKSMQNELLALGNHEVKKVLANNSALSHEIVEELIQSSDAELIQLLLTKQNLDEKYLREAYKKSENHKAIAKNPALPQDMAEELFKSNDAEVLKNLAANEATPVDILYQLQLDSRFERAVKTNGAFGKHIQSENIGWLV